ncbi:MAG: hypothetical protein A2X42_09640 [Candidatus Margulisbacteria bacterium GWF2_38_17]|nr:MAG: hypothetical protein A2X43_00990 [Candidatus Margulisbacteria bacterium GWD2_39_127]OGI02426.1 MAG: hypothetical protein A2X42_09640 [Candidatus Margulisbacteria bacterium GWF2_38_17]OGI08560.1 MAG: hypothetical protein A2X41_07425 [Candidatus Margulisbacteria bacterium GWE2_39_32]
MIAKINWILSNLVGKTLELTVWTYFTFICKGKVNHIEKLPNGPCILAFNHESYMDWMFVYDIFKRNYKKKIYFVAKKKLFTSYFFNLLMQYGNAICLNQEKVDKSSIKEILRVLKKDSGIIGIFPEGTRSRTGKLLKGYPGIVKLWKLSKVPIVPVGLNGFYEVLPPSCIIPRRFSCSIDIGTPLYYEQIVKGSHNDDFLVSNIMQEIAKLTNQEYEFCID